MATVAPPSGTSGILARLIGRRTAFSADGSPESFAGPIRGELLGTEGLAEHARALGRAQRIVAQAPATGWRLWPGREGPLLARLDDTRRVLEQIRQRVNDAAEHGADVSPAGEWLLDNFYVIQEHMREVRAGMPKGYYQELPKLAAGALAGYPRIYEIAIELIAHTEGFLQLDNIELFVREFQRAMPLTVGELWATPTMLRLGLIENVRRMAVRVVQRLDEQDAADRWAKRLREASEGGAQNLSEVMAEFVNHHPPLTPAFITRFLQQIRSYQTNFAPLQWLEQWIAEDGLSAEDAVTRSNQRLALTQVMMANSITSLRTIARLDWSAWVETMSVTESMLRQDPAGIFERMTFRSRDHYRHVIEELAKGTGMVESDVTQRALDLALRGTDERTRHVGYYLVGDGLAELQAAIGYQPQAKERLYQWVLDHAELVYFGGIVLGTVVMLVIALALIGSMSVGEMVAVLVLALIPANDIAINIEHQILSLLLPPRVLPKLDYEDGIAPECRSVVVVPTLVGSVEAVDEALEHLEVQFLANRDPRLHFALLSDFTDSPTEVREGDDAIIARATSGIERLNAKYPGADGDLFFLFHRARQWNARQGAWLAWERKRGKLSQFNEYLRGGARDAFRWVVGDTAPLSQVRYVVTLDSDTVLPRGAAALLIGAMAHPLNRGVYDAASGRVVEGYGILQPRVGISLESANRSLFASIASGHPGVDPYTTAVSDVYQDLFAEGSYTGKGIYDVDVFEQATAGRFPDNTLLSHDLIEGAYARAALCTDVEFYDDYPTRYLTYTRRKHRWIRGDWQLLRWLGRMAPSAGGDQPNRLSRISRWKIFDNLRRSVVEIAQLVLLVAGWTVLPGGPFLWTALVLVGMASPWVFSLALEVLRPPPRDMSWRSYYRGVGRDVVTAFEQYALAVIFLPHQAVVSADAIVRTLWRLLVTRRNLLEWQTASQVERLEGSTGRFREVWRRMWPAVALTALVLGLVVTRAAHHGMVRVPAGLAGAGFYRYESATRWWYLALTLPLIALWALSPTFAILLSRPVVRRDRRLGQAESWTALRYALLHWHYFDRFVTADTQWLAPDNYQEDPLPVVAMRTSPTNIGLQLLGTVSAYDLGFLSGGALVERLELVFRALERMTRFKGHFYNWYDLHDLRVLEPAYISTVDSGNLAGHLLSLKQALYEVADDPVVDTRVWDALQTSLTLAAEELRSLASSGDVANPRQWQAVLEAGERVRAVLASLPQATGGGKDSARGVDVAALSTLVERLRTAERILAQRGDDGSGVSAVVSGTAVGVLEAPVALDVDGNASLSEGNGNGNGGGDGATATATVARPAAVTVEGLDAAATGRIWLRWGRTLLERQVADLQALGMPLGEGRVPTLREAAATSSHAAEQIKRLDALAARAHAYAMETDFAFLFDERRKLFSIGYAVNAGMLDQSCYDLLASEARLASFVAIAKDDVAAEHWFRLGRALTETAGGTALISWSGSMFEYLMPALVMESFPFTLLDQTYQGALQRQIAYGTERGVPWGVSESAYNARDRMQTYQYRAFGVPDLALKRGLDKDLVIAPYATALALVVDPHAAMRNLGVLERVGALGPFGFRDAVDYTRPAVGSTLSVVGAYMAHHIGMSLVALNNAINHGVWQERFHRDPIVKSAELVLFERIPRRFILSEAQTGEADEYPRRRGAEKPAARQLDTANTPQPRVTLLGHAPYTVMITNSGAGYSRFEQMAVTRWRNDGTLDDSGQWCYVRDVASGRVWSAAYQPTGAEPDLYRVTFASDRATFHRRDGEIDTRLEVTVVPDDSAEVRRVTLTNNGSTARDIELTTYGEIVINAPDADRGHPAFQNLFIETEYVMGHAAILATRRPRSSDEQAPWLVHVAAIGREAVGAVSCETDRAQFVGRNRSARQPAAMDDDALGPLSGTTGAVLDPIFALRTRVKVPPGQSVRVAFTTIVAPDRDQAMELADRYADPYSAQRALDLSWMHAQVELRELGITPADGALYQELAGYLLYSNPAVRVAPREIMGVRRGQEALWAHGISGDWPILLATVDSSAGVSTVKELLQAHHYWRLKGLTADLVLLNTYPPTYLQELNDELQAAIMASSEAGIVDKPGGVFLRRRDLMPPDDLATLRAAARVHVLCDGLRLSEILELPEAPDEYPPAFVPLGHAQTGTGIVSPGLLATAAARSTPGGAAAAVAAGREALAFDNGIGGLLADGTYEIRLAGAVTTPAPWTNCIANETVGFLASENGGGCTWVGSSQFYRLTPWRNDPVRDAPTEIIYLRDDETGELWTPTPDPIRHATPYVVRHAAGRTEFRHSHMGISTSLVLGVAGSDPVKLALLTITNDTAAARRLTLTSYVEWTLGTLREHTQHEVRTVLDRETEALFAQNVTDADFASQVAFTAVSVPVASFTADRREFIGRNGDYARPAALERMSLSEVTGAAIDPCAVLQGSLTLAAGETRQVVVLLGAAEGEVEARRLVARYRDVGVASRALEASVTTWRSRLGAVRVTTPDPAFDAVLNGWLLYQALSCRFWGRTALYQSSGAFGFRDQLQDCMAFVYAEPALARAHILRSTARQFKEGDVQHWWHPHNGKGVRTRISDDLVWLPWVVDHYVTVTGDASVLDEMVPFLTMRTLEPGEVEIYDTPQVSGEQGSVYEHCMRALRRAATSGAHGLPLMGTGDWNDGMNRVGAGGAGESVWLAWFIIGAQRRFAAHCEARGDMTSARELRAKADAYADAVERTSWDGEWYRRAYFDDGTPLGSASSEECKIDAIAQSWSVISGAGQPERARIANESLYTHLVRGDGRLIELLTPPFDHTTHDPGYIKGYLPGVRENGAQYTHAATWSVLARALLGEGDVAFIMYQMLNPFTHAESAADADVYKVEPFVIAADVYTAAGHLGRGGWTWYTGSASWAYRVGLEAMLGFHKRGATLVMEPCIPMAWGGFSLSYRVGAATYEIVVQNPEHVNRGVSTVTVDGARVASGVVPLVDDGKVHTVVVVMGDPA